MRLADSPLSETQGFQAGRSPALDRRTGRNRARVAVQRRSSFRHRRARLAPRFRPLAVDGDVACPTAGPIRPDQKARPHRRRPARPDCGRTSRPAAGAAALRRRVLLGIAATGILVALALPWGGTGGRPLATPGSPPAGDPIAPHTEYVVQPGDTLWSIAERLDPTGDPRVIVGELSAEIGGDLVRSGQRIRLP